MPNLRIAELDFDDIKQNLKEFLNSQTEFADYDFEGSGLSVLLDILAYNTHYNAYLANMVINEMFLDSAIKRSSVVSLAKQLGYTPRSARAAIAKLDVTVNSPDNLPTILTLEKFTPFSTNINGKSYTFYNLETKTTTPVNDTYLFSNLEVYEGTLLQYQHVVATPGPDEKYEIPNENIDTNTIQVIVQNSSSDLTSFTYNLAKDITNLNTASKVFFLEENPFGRYQLYFGDGVLGKLLSAGNIIKISYLSTSGEQCNVSSNFTQNFVCDNEIGGSDNITVSVLSNSTNGTQKEALSSIKFNAPKYNLTKNRAVTRNDYAALIKAEYPQVEAVSVWGGEDNEPPSYGKVFISLKPYNGFVVDDAVKNYIKNSILKDRQVLTVVPEFVEPEFLYLKLDIDVTYDSNLTELDSGQLTNLVRATTLSYFNTELQQFEKNFYYSSLLQKLNNSDPAIVGVLASLTIQKRLIPVLNIRNSYIDNNVLQFNNKIHPNGISSTRFFISVDNNIIPVVLKDIPSEVPANYDGSGKVLLFNAETGSALNEVGTVNYATGEIIINGITPVGYPNGQFDIRVSAEVQENSYNVRALKNQIILIDDSTESQQANRNSGLTIKVDIL